MSDWGMKNYVKFTVYNLRYTGHTDVLFYCIA